MTLSTNARAVLLSAILLAGSAYLAHASRAEIVAPRHALDSLPLRIDQWRGERAPDFDERILSVLGVDEYVNRVYAGASGPVGLYIGYYQSQRQGDAIHSPLNCLPGAGWQPVETGRLTLDLRSASGASRPVEVNNVVIQKGEDRQVVLYWYQSHGRVVASEYWGKFYLVADAVRLNRTDAALIRIISPVGRDEESSRHATERAAAFARALFPRLEPYLPN